MTICRLTRAWVVGVALLAGLVGTSAAERTVSIRGDLVNMRAAPSLSGEVLWQLGDGYPLKVLDRRGNWVQVVDFENDKGWVSRRYIGTKPHAVVKSPRANVRSGPGTRYRIVGSAEYGEVLRVLGKRKSWVRVQDEDARKGWIARGLLWGF